MDLMFVVTNPASAPILLPLARACARRGIDWGCVFTNDGVQVLGDGALIDVLGAASQTVACETSWSQYMAGHSCPIELGSQTNHSAMMVEAARVVSL